MKKSLVYLGVLIGLPLIVCIGLSTCGLLYVNRYPGGEWESYPQPPVRAVEILTTNEFFELYVRAIDGSVFNCHEFDGCRKISVEEISHSEDLCGFTREEKPPEPPGKVVDSADFQLCGTDVTIYTSYVILEDGSIWQWGYGTGWGEGLMISYIVIGGTIGTFIVVVILISWLALKDIRHYLYQESLRR